MIAALGDVHAYGGTTLEGFDVCSYRWFVSHELAPQPLDPAPDPLVQGGIVHAALYSLYKERPGGDPLPRPGSLSAWIARGRELVGEIAAARGLGEHPAERAMLARVEGLLARFLAEEARRETAGFEPWLLEAGFSESEEVEQPALEIDGWRLHGAIDRVDRAPDGRALVLDYKLSSKVSPRVKLEEEAKLQLQLYLIAVAELWGAEIVGGLYHPLRATSERRPRGLVLEDAAAELAGYGLAKTDRVDRGGVRGAARRRPPTRRRDRRPDAEPGRSTATPARARACATTASARRSATSRRSAAATGRRSSRWATRRRTSGERARADRRSSEPRSRRRAPRCWSRRAPAPARPASWSTATAGWSASSGISPDAVLAFTFTDKAAAELRQRIRAEIERRAEAGSERARELLPGLGSAWVTTIHGFCNRLLSAHPVAVGIDPRFRVLDAPETERAAGEAFDEALEAFLAEGDREPRGHGRGVRHRRPAGDGDRRPRRAAQPRRGRAPSFPSRPSRTCRERCATPRRPPRRRSRS